MKRFIKPGQRVKVSLDGHELNGRTGTVERMRICDDGAWVDIDGGLPSELRKFPEDDEFGRGNHIILYPDECEEALK